jgi:hypothetical protein
MREKRADLQVFLPFITENYQNIRLLLKEPGTISVAQSSVDDPYTGIYSLVFSPGMYIQVLQNGSQYFLFLNLSDKSGKLLPYPARLTEKHLADLLFHTL